MLSSRQVKESNL